MVAFDGPLGMLADPLGNVGLGGHGTLRQRAVPHVFETLLLAVIGVRQRTNRNHNRYQIHEISPSEDPATQMQLSCNYNTQIPKSFRSARISASVVPTMHSAI